MAEAFSFAFIGANYFTTAAECFAIVLGAAGMFLGCRTSPLPPARILAVFSLSLALVQPATQMHIRGSNLCDYAALPAFDFLVLFATSEHCSRRQSAESSSRELMEIASVKRLLSHEMVV